MSAKMSGGSDLSWTKQFPPADYETWRTLAEAAIKGGDFDRRLVSRTADGIALQPVYPRCKDGPSSVASTTAPQPWRLVQRVDHPEPEVAARQAVTDLEGGADTLALVFPASALARGFGVRCNTVADLDASLAGTALDMIRLRLEPAPAGRINAALVAALAERRGHDPSNLDVTFGMDPIGTLVTLGAFSADWKEVGRRLGETVSTLSNKGFRGPFIECDVRPFHEAGASEVQELSIALAMGVAYWRALSDNGISVADAERAIAWTFAIDTDQFLSIAKLRAMRRLWARVQDASGLPIRPIPIHAETAWRTMTRHDPAVNMIRSTIAAFSAAIGGADSLSVLPHTLALGLPESFARRVARNTQAVLMEESNLWRVADPAAGSGAYEELTSELCRQAWSAFQDIERADGIQAVLTAGRLQKSIAKTLGTRQDEVAKLRQPLIGTSAFPFLAEVPPKVLPIPPDPKRDLPQLRAGKPDMPLPDVISALLDGDSRSDVTPAPQTTVRVRPLPSVRLAEPFERLRDRADAAKPKMGRTPSVFLANIGPLAENTARTMWIRNLLAAGGIESVVVSDGFTTSADVGRAFLESGLSVACICGSDEAYSTLADATASLLKTVGAKKVYIARKPASPEVRSTGVGIDGYIYSGADAVGWLRKVHDAIGI